MPENAKNAKFCRSHIKRKKRKKNIKIDIIIYDFDSFIPSVITAKQYKWPTLTRHITHINGMGDL
jgi:hypothetical protein